MPPTHRQSDVCTGHGCWPPRPTGTYAATTYANNLKIHRLHDSYVVHCCPPPNCHGAIGTSGSSTVIVENKPARRIGDTVSCGGVAAVGSPNVIIGG